MVGSLAGSVPNLWKRISAYPGRSAVGTMNRRRPCVINAVVVLGPTDVPGVFRALDAVALKVLSGADVNELERRFVRSVLFHLIGDGPTLSRNVPGTERERAVGGPCVRVEQDLTLARFALPPIDDRLLLPGLLLHPEVAPTEPKWRGLPIHVIQLREALSQRLGEWQGVETSSGERVLRSHPLLHLGVRGVLEPAIRIANYHAVNLLGRRVLVRGRIDALGAHRCRGRGGCRSGRGSR